MTANTWKLWLSLTAASLLALAATAEAEAEPPVIVDFLAKAPEARWTNAHLRLPFPGSGSDARGFARIMNNVRLEDDKTYDGVLQTHPRWRPNGIIVGRYSNVMIPQAGAELRAAIGFIKGATGSDGVYFEVKTECPGYSGIPLRLQYHKKYSKYLISDFTQDLSRFGGRRVSISLVVNAGEKSSAQDWAVWVRPRLISLGNEVRFASFVGGAVGSGRRDDRLLNAWGGKSGLLYGDIKLYLQFSNVTRSLSLRIDSYHQNQFVGTTDLGQVRPGRERVWRTLRRTRLGRWKETVVFNGTYWGDITYTVNNVGE